MTRRTKIVMGVAAVAAVAAGIVWAGFGRSAANTQRLLGTWAYVSGGNGRGGTLTFTEDGKMKAAARSAGKTSESEGTYLVNGDTVEMLVADDSVWGEEWWADWAGKAEGDKNTKRTTDPKSKPQSRPEQRGEPKPRTVTIRSLSGTELVVVDETGRKTVYARK
ncbi:hypothetical protein [Frigoriglobus tundricola]|uniref:Lipocalin-like domain-containing protein n=1 Tax=Frigoriglobus tundricola TaxID=2774151 RepID=A0A6M5YSR6_9BACT|nr:hypothetical protein [Frigoriglobus tundricola]QJW96456.1 hypothetical protein FTUN_4013 [Frigoriglobus tundricola]